MDLLYIKILLVVNTWLAAEGYPVAMQQHATSSQSFVFHPAASNPSTVSDSSGVDQHSDNHAQYEYKYEVSDHNTGDRKSHWESRDGDRVRGVYTLYEPDGALRTVEYSADALHGFNAVVRRNEPSRHSHSRHESSFKSTPSSGHDSYNRPGYSGHNNEGNSFLSQSLGNDASGYPPAKAPYNPGVGFSVNHLTKKSGDSTSTQWGF